MADKNFVKIFDESKNCVYLKRLYFELSLYFLFHSKEMAIFLLLIIIVVSMILLFFLMNRNPSMSNQEYAEKQNLRGKSSDYQEDIPSNIKKSQYPTPSVLYNEKEKSITPTTITPTVSLNKIPIRNSAIPNSQKNNIPIGVKPDTLHYNFPKYNENELYYGKYKTVLQDNELSSIKEQSQIMAEYVKQSMKFFWSGYEKCSFGMDEINPLTCKGSNNWGGIGMTIIDCLDTLYLMDLKEEFYKAEKWLFDHLDYKKINRRMSHFEYTIRILGGLLSMYSLTKNDFYKSKSIELGELLYSSFNGNIPYKEFNVKSGEGSGASICVAEAGTFQLEFIYLSKISGDNKYNNKAYETYDYLFNNLKNDLFYSDITSGSFGVGGNSDSIYEYILKVWIETGKTDNKLRDIFNRNKNGIKNILAKRSKNGILTVGKDGDASMEHLSCFLPGLIALDIYHYKELFENVTEREEEMEFAKSLMYTCYEMYMSTATHLAPEIMRVDGETMVVSTAFNILRPEAVESLYLLHEVTNDPIFLKWGWDIYNAFEESSRVRNGYSALNNVNQKGSYMDNCQSFFGSETLKYLYLLFDTNKKVDLNKYVFNTEAHPFDL